MILLSAHQDIVTPFNDIGFENGEHTGILDNFLGMLAIYIAFYRDRSIFHLHKQGKLSVFHSIHEEFLLGHYEGEVPKFVIVVDVASGKQYKDIDFSLENISVPNREKFEQDVVESLRSEGFRFTTKDYTGEAKDADESWLWKEKSIPVVSLILPIEPKDEVLGWHTLARCKANRMSKFAAALTRLICFLPEYY